jgi:hypothetical protein
MRRAEVNTRQFLHRLTAADASLRPAQYLLHNSGRTCRVDKMALC